ncbi:MAG: DUF6049 family protein [Pyrinomonadaceae bacterium]
MNLRNAIVRLLLLTFTLGAIAPSPGFVANGQSDTPDEEETGLRFRLSEGVTPIEKPTPSPIVTATNLSEADTQKLLARLPAFTPNAGDILEFKFPARTLLPPRTGKIIEAAFTAPAAGGPPVVAPTMAPLEILRVSPDGEVELAPMVSITFSQPMIAVSSQEEAAAQVPVTLTPQPKGRWRWLGTQTLVFQPEADAGRFPMATKYTVTIPAGTKSVFGNGLTEARTFTFATPSPRVKLNYPTKVGQRRDTLMFVEFDQRIDVEQTLSKIDLQAAGKVIRTRRATDQEIAADRAVSQLVKEATDGRWLAFRAVSTNGSTQEALPADALVKISLTAGIVSAEGPGETLVNQRFEFKTLAPFQVTNTTICIQARCSPYEQLYLTTNNQIDSNAFQPGLVSITPAIPGVKIGASGSLISIEGLKKSNTEYTVTLDRSLRDEAGQSLIGENRFKFAMTTAPPRLFSLNQEFFILDPAVKRTFNVFNLNYRQIHVKLYQVTPDDWPRYQAYRSAQQNRLGKVIPAPPGTIVFDRVLELNPKLDELTETAIDLSPALKVGYGQVFVQVEAVEPGGGRETPMRIYAYSQSGPIEAWVQATDIGLDAFADNTQLYAWANSLLDGKPIKGVEVQARPYTEKAVTDKNGLTRFDLDRATLSTDPNELAILVARRGNDLAFLPDGYSSNSWRPYQGTDSTRWWVFDDRKLYRPGEEVSVKGWVRTLRLTPTGDTELWPTAGDTVNYTLTDARGNEITKGSTTLNPLAGFDLKLQLPANMNLGSAELELTLASSSDSFQHTFRVEEFRRPEFEIKTAISEGPYLVGSSANFTAKAAYYTGGGLANTAVDWTVAAEPTNYTPPGREDFVFGKFFPWWIERYHSENTSDEQEFKGKTDSKGAHNLRVDFDGVRPARPSRVSVEATVQDVNRQSLSDRWWILVHPADVYVGVKSARTFVQAGQPFDLSLIATDLDGKTVSGRDIKLRLVRQDRLFESGEWVEKEVDAQEQTVKSASDAISVRFPTKGGGEYRLIAQIHDDRGRLNETELTLWVAGGWHSAPHGIEQETVELIPDRKSYAGGDVAEVLVQSPFGAAEGVMTLRRSGLLRTERFTMKDGTYTLRIPIEDGMTPNVQVQVDLVGTAPRVGDDGQARPDLPSRTAYATGELRLDIPPTKRRLKVEATPRDAMLEPGGETTVDVLVTDAQGKGVAGTDTAVVVVDESVLALAGYRFEDPLDIFYPDRDANVGDHHSRGLVRLLDPQAVEQLKHAPNAIVTIESGGSAINTTEISLNGRDPLRLIRLARRYGGLDTTSNTSGTNVSTEYSIGFSGGSEVEIRRNFNALATFAASVPTDAQGRAQVKVKLPDNLTRYRILAYSVSEGTMAGWGTSVITARKQLMARPSAPRFLNFGDRAELPVVLQNQTDQPMSVDVAVRAINAELTAGAGRRVTIPANDRVEVRFPVTSALPGLARFQVVTTAGALTDAAEISLPVYTPATTEAFATYGTIDRGNIAQPVKAPVDALPGFGGLEVTTASTQLQELTDAVIYLNNYPFECSEQISSRLMALAALKAVLTAFKVKDLPSPEAMSASVDRDLKRLSGLQNEDGGFDFWIRGKTSNPYVSVHVAHALVRAQSKGFAVPEEMLNDSKGFLQNIESKISLDYSPESRFAIRAYALYVRNLMKDTDSVKARQLMADAGGVEKLSLESLGWLLPVLSADPASAETVTAIRRHINNRITETAGAAHFADSYSDGAYTILYSDRRTDGVLLEALIGDQPNSDLIPKLVRGLLEGRKQGRWKNTQENVFILLALDRYFNTYEKATPDFVARVWLGPDHAGDQIFKGRSVDRQQLNLRMATLAQRTTNGPTNLTIAKEGEGRLYYRIGTRYAPKSLNLAAADYGFKVERVYEAVDNVSDVRRDADGTWVIKAGSRVRVRLKMSNPSRRYHVALVDPLPAGLEVLNPELATTEKLPDGHDDNNRNDDYNWYWRRIWFEHQNLRDDRVEAFTYNLWEGEHVYTYFARATTLGVFIVPPTKAEEMYAPETFGRGASDKVRIE